MNSRPPYRLPLLSERPGPAEDAPTAISTFSGCGGASLGLKAAGFNILLASEFVDEARACYRANSYETRILPGDIRDTKVSEFLEAAGVAPGELDLLEGSPPCSSFSVSGTREKAWGKSKKYSERAQVTDDLFLEFVRVLKGVQPKAFVAENVRGLIIGSAKGYFKLILRAMSEAGYRVQARVLDAQWLGVPQRRKRLIFVGMRNDLDVDPGIAFPDPLGYRYSLRDAIGRGDVPLDAERPAPSIVGYAIHPEWEKLLPGKSSDRYFNLVRADWNKPCPTVTATTAVAASAGVCHPSEPRKFSLPELRRICGFPDDFILTGTYKQAAERCGRAVPPPMYEAVGQSIKGALEL